MGWQMHLQVIEGSRESKTERGQSILFSRKVLDGLRYYRAGFKPCPGISLMSQPLLRQAGWMEGPGNSPVASPKDRQQWKNHTHILWSVGG